MIEKMFEPQNTGMSMFPGYVAVIHKARTSWESDLKVLKKYVLATAIVNLSTDTVESIFRKAEFDWGNTSTNKYTEFFASLTEMLYDEEDVYRYQSKFSPQALINAYTGGISRITADYRYKNKQGNILWLSTTVEMFADPVSQDLYAFGIVKDINEQIKWEFNLPVEIARDPETHLYTIETAECIIKTVLKNNTPANTRCSLVLIEINITLTVRNLTGDKSGNQILVLTQQLFRLLLDSKCVIGKFNCNRMILFWPNVASDEWVRERIEEMIAEIRYLYRLNDIPENITFTAGIATEYYNADYAEMFAQVSGICEKTRSEYKDTVTTFDKFSADSTYVPAVMDAQSLVPVSPVKAERSLSAEEKNVMINILTYIHKTHNYDAFINVLLRELGKFYQADRIYTLALEKETVAFTAQHEWLAHGKSSILQIIKDIPIAEMPLMQKIFAYKCHILHEEKPIIQLFESHSTLNTAIKKCIFAPIDINGKILGFLCIENPKIHADDIALITTLLPIAVFEQTRYGTSYFGENTIGRDVLTGLMNYGAYIEMLHQLNANIYLSLGVLRIDIQSLNRINAVRGKDFGNKLLLFAAKAMMRIFGGANMYRISGQAFALLYPNVISQVFMEKCQQLQTELDSRYPDIFNLGYTWAEKHFTAHKLVENAEKILQYNIQSLDATNKFTMRNQAEALMALKSGIVNGRYVIYIQSKNRIDTGQMIGGEALVRYLDPKGGIIAPDEFIERMEKENIIRDLDFYVFDQILQIMHSWKLNRRKLVPISVNFSRQTLLDRSALSYLIDIHSRYDIPAEMIEIEITESIGDIEREVIARAVKGLKEHGFKLSLDDFGAAYSNLSLLTSVSFDSVKLDKGIISNFTVNKISNTIVESMIKICESMNALCIAEGVETEKQAQALLQAGCKYAQGYYYDKPLSANAFEKKYLKQ